MGYLYACVPACEGVHAPSDSSFVDVIDVDVEILGLQQFTDTLAEDPDIIVIHFFPFLSRNFFGRLPLGVLLPRSAKRSFFGTNPLLGFDTNWGLTLENEKRQMRLRDDLFRTSSFGSHD